MKFHTVFTESGVHFESDSYKQCLEETALELNVPQTELDIHPDAIDGEQYEQVFIGVEGGEPLAYIYNDEQYARIRS